MRVLVVEDEELVRTVAVAALEEAGFQVIEATTGEDAMAHCDERIADILFTDIMLPGKITGWDIAEHCRKRDPHLPVVYATGYSWPKPRFVSGSRFLQKPYTPTHIVDAINDLLRQRPASCP
jgi:CheY-like chemotaxis protein